MKPAKRIRVYIGEDERYQGKPLFEAILLEARESGLAGATVFRGFMGYAPNASHVSNARIELLAGNLPMVVDIIDDEERIRGFLPFLRRVVKTGIVTCSDVKSERVIPDEAAG